MQIPPKHFKDNKVSSLWVAQECGKMHLHVLRDIRARAEKGFHDFNPNLDLSLLNPPGSAGRPSQVIWLSLPEASLLMSSYTGPKAEKARIMCLSLIDSGMARHMGHKPQHTELYKGTSLEADAYQDEDDEDLRELRDIERSIQQQILRKIEIKRLEKKMVKVESKLEDHQTRLDRMNGDLGYRTILGHCSEKGIHLPAYLAKGLGKKISSRCRQYGHPIGSVPDERFGKVNSYPVSVIEEVIAEAYATLKRA